jgi:radical SAM superfamily enzyme YgiQ (UPF0313 family)
MHKLLLNCLPPTDVKWASPALSILKGFMEANGFKTEVHYWNISLHDFLKEYSNNSALFDNEEFLPIFPFLNYIACDCEDDNLRNKITHHYWAIFPFLINDNTSTFVDFFKENATCLEILIKKQLENLHINECLLFGVSAKLFQLIPANVITKIVKSVSPNIKTVIGGIGTKEEAIAIMDNFPWYDFAIWGEGEYPLLGLYESVLSKDWNNLLNVPNLIFRDGTDLKISVSTKKYFLDLNDSILPDYSDFFIQNNISKNESILIPIEGSRGCHWRKCKFCFLNDGYKYRQKNVNNIIQEIKKNIELYGIKNCLFLDNDIIGNNMDNFVCFLDSLIDLRRTHEDLKISGAEIITKHINSHVIKKMILAGIHRVQVGYESTSDVLLQKISKKNSFASNLLFIKWAKYYGIGVHGLNVLRGLLEETDENIMEATDNLHFLRFFKIEQNISGLAIGSSSRYFKEINQNNKLEEWSVNQYADLLPNTYFNEKDRFKLFFYTNKAYNNLWCLFEEINKHYYNNLYEYSIIENMEIISYIEMYNGTVINEIEFNNIVHWNVLKICNDEVKSITEILLELKKNNIDILKDELVAIIIDLKKSFLLFANIDFSEVVSVINTNKF